MSDSGKTQEMPPYKGEDEETNNRKELSPDEKIEQALALTIEDLHVANRNDISVNQIVGLVKENWEILTTLINTRVPSDYDKTAVQSMVKLFSIESDATGLPVVISSRNEMPDPESVSSKDENYGQLDIQGGRWLLRLDSEALRLRVDDGDRAVADELAHEFMAWKLFSTPPKTPEMIDKIERNKKIQTTTLVPTKNSTILQTHFFDKFFEKLVYLSR